MTAQHLNVNLFYKYQDHSHLTSNPGGPLKPCSPGSPLGPFREGTWIQLLVSMVQDYSEVIFIFTWFCLNVFVMCLLHFSWFKVCFDLRFQKEYEGCVVKAADTKHNPECGALRKEKIIVILALSVRNKIKNLILFPCLLYPQCTKKYLAFYSHPHKWNRQRIRSVHYCLLQFNLLS